MTEALDFGFEIADFDLVWFSTRNPQRATRNNERNDQNELNDPNQQQY